MDSDNQLESFSTMQHPPSPTTSAHTYMMSSVPVQDRRASGEVYKPKIISTIGQRPACLVSASVTYVGKREIYAFGGFDQYTDEVYNHVLRLNLDTRQWNLVDNYGDIPGVRMGHTATLWQGNKLIVFGGENEHRAHLCDVIIFDIETSQWHQPMIYGPVPRARARHAAVIHNDKLFVTGGLSGTENAMIIDDLCYLDLNTWTWSRTWRFAHRFDHTCWVWAGRLWTFGGMNEGMERVSEIWWLDISQNPSFNLQTVVTADWRSYPARNPRAQQFLGGQGSAASTGYAANSSSVQSSQGQRWTQQRLGMAPGAISSASFVSGPNIPSQSVGTHFHAFSSGMLLDFVTPALTASSETSLSAVDLSFMRWEKIADGKELFNLNFRWHYCTLNQDGTHAWLLGCPKEQSIAPPGGSGASEYLSDVLAIDLRKVGLLGNNLTSDSTQLRTSDTTSASPLSGIGADLCQMFDRPLERRHGNEFIITAESDDMDTSEGEESIPTAARDGSQRKQPPPIHVDRLILEARWPHFARMIAAQMSEFHTNKLHIPEPYSVVRAFLLYLYTDSITQQGHVRPALDVVAGMLVMANCYDMPRLRLLCRNRLGRELDVEHAAIIWERADLANEEWLKRRAARFCMTHWGRVVRTAGFQCLRRRSVMELCQEIDTEGRVVGAEELECVGGLGGAKLGSSTDSREGYSRTRRDSVGGGMHDETDDMDEEEGIEVV